jgi:hypothetical protein
MARNLYPLQVKGYSMIKGVSLPGYGFGLSRLFGLWENVAHNDFLTDTDVFDTAKKAVRQNEN